MISLVLTVIGPDKPGLVERLSQHLAQHQGNWMESSLSRLGGKFAGIVLVTIPKDQQAAFTHSLSSLESDGLKVGVELAESTTANSSSHQQLFTLELVGHDKPGIVREISQALARHQINVESLNTELVSGSMSAELLFKADAQLLAPENLDMDQLQEALEAIANDLMVDISLNN